MPDFFRDRIFRESSHLNGFSGSRIERASEARSETCVEEALADPRARIYVFHGDRPLLVSGVEGSTLLATPEDARRLGVDPRAIVLLGTAPEGPRLAALLAADREIGEGALAGDLRAIASEGAHPGHDIAALAQARAYLHWHDSNRFCGHCGGPLAVLAGGASRKCGTCGKQVFPRVDPVVIMLAIDGDRCLLGRQARFPPGRYSALAGFLEPGETIEDAVRREIREEAGIGIGRVAYHSSQAWPFPSSLMIACHAEAATTELHPDLDELEDCRWVSRTELRQMLAGVHRDGFSAPPAMAIARSLLTAFAEFGDPA